MKSITFCLSECDCLHYCATAQGHSLARLSDHNTEPDVFTGLNKQSNNKDATTQSNSPGQQRCINNKSTTKTQQHQYNSAATKIQRQISTTNVISIFNIMIWYMHKHRSKYTSFFFLSAVQILLALNPEGRVPITVRFEEDYNQYICFR